MSRHRTSRILPSEITSREVFLNRRELLMGAVAAGLVPQALAESPQPAAAKLNYTRNAKYSVDLKPNAFEDITGYNNFYEFGTDKSDPARYAGKLTVRPWTTKIDGHVAKPGAYQIEDLLKFPLEERVYRLRCVEAWSMVIPWIGFPLGDLLKKVEPTSKAKYVAFETVMRPAEMPGQRTAALEWPYVEGLRLDEAQHPLTLLAVGLYGKTLPNQNGAPIRLVVPWKYAFKGIKSIVRISLVEKQPDTTWNLAAPSE